MRDSIIIVEGAQGAGKTTVTNYLREKLLTTDLYRLTGIKDKTETGHKKIKKKYDKLLEYMEACEDVNLLFDRTFFTNEIYARLGYFEYSFTETFNELLQKLDNLDFDIYLVILYLENENDFEERLKRDKPAYQKFEVESSIAQQREYFKLAEEVQNKTKNIKIVKIHNEVWEETEKQIIDNFGNLMR